MPYSIEYRLVGPGNTILWIHERGYPIADESGPVRLMTGVCTEITERKRGAEQLERSRDELRALSYQLADAQEAERRHLARELHDEIGQQLTLIKIALDMLPRLPTDAAQVGLRDASGRIGGLIDVVCDLSQSLSPSLLDDLDVRQRGLRPGGVPQGASGYVLKDSTADDLVTAIRRAAAGERFLSPPLSQRDLEDYERRIKDGRKDPYETLTAREREVLQLVSEGWTSARLRNGCSAVSARSRRIGPT